MLPRVLHLQPATHRRLVRLSKEAERDGAYRASNVTGNLALSSPNSVWRTFKVLFSLRWRPLQVVVC